MGDDVHRAVARVAVGVDHREGAGLQGDVERAEDGVGAGRARRQQRHPDRALRHVGVGELAVGDVGEHRLAVDLDVGGSDGRRVGEQDAGLAGTDRSGRCDVGVDDRVAPDVRRQVQHDVAGVAGADVEGRLHLDALAAERDLVAAGRELERPEHLSDAGAAGDRATVDGHVDRRPGDGLHDVDTGR